MAESEKTVRDASVYSSATTPPTSACEHALNGLVMRSSLGGDEDQGAELPTVVRDSRRRARCVPDRPVNAGNLRSFADSLMRRLTCE